MAIATTKRTKAERPAIQPERPGELEPEGPWGMLTLILYTLLVLSIVVWSGRQVRVDTLTERPCPHMNSLLAAIERDHPRVGELGRHDCTADGRFTHLVNPTELEP